MKKRGQLLGTPFVMIFALVVGAMILVGGLYYIFKLTKTAGEISIAKEVNDFKTQARTYYYLEEGNSKKLKISLPGQAKNICFYDSAYLDDPTYPNKWNPPAEPGVGYPSDFKTRIAFYKKFFESFREKNMFVLPTKEFKESAFAVQYLNLKTQGNNPICIKNNGYIRLISMGDHVEVKAE